MKAATLTEIMDLVDANAKAYYMGRGEDTRKQVQAAIAGALEAETATIRVALQDYNNPAASLASLVDILVTGVRQELQAKENYRHDLEMTERQRDAALARLAGLEEALVYAAHMGHGTPQHMTPEGICPP